MEIISYPENYSGAYAEAIYTVAANDPGKTIEAEIICGDGETLGIKRFRGEEAYNINISAYVSSRVSVEPFYEASSGFYRCPGRSGAAYLRISEYGGAEGSNEGHDTVESDRRIFTAGAVNGQEWKLLTHSPKRRTISIGEFDEIPFIAPGGEVWATVRLSGKVGTKTVVIGTGCGYEESGMPGFRCGEGVFAFIINTSGIAAAIGGNGLEDYSRMTVEINGKSDDSPEDIEIGVREYVLHPADDQQVRICWLNRLGGIDYHSFAWLRSEEVVADKGKAYTQAGYETTRSEADVHYSLVCALETEAAMRWLSEVICSPKVWRVQGEEFIPVDVTTGSVSVRAAKTDAFVLSFREQAKRRFQKSI